MIYLTNGCNAFKAVGSPTRAEYLLRHGWQMVVVPEDEAETKAEAPKSSPRKKIVIEGDKTCTEVGSRDSC